MPLRNPLVRGLIVHEPAAVFLYDLLRLLLQGLKVAPILPVVDLLIQGKKVRVLIGDIVHDGSFFIYNAIAISSSSRSTMKRGTFNILPSKLKLRRERRTMTGVSAGYSFS